MEKHIPRNAFVLDIGSGDHPHRRADVLCDKYLEIDDLQRRHGTIVIDRPFVIADITSLPFVDSAFDYVICGGMLYQIEDVKSALEEVGRVGKAGYICTYSELNEILTPFPHTQWVSALKDGILVFKPKSSTHELGTRQLFGSVFWQLHRDRQFMQFMLDHSRLFWAELEWKDRINYHLVSEDFQLYDYNDPHQLAELIRPTPPKGLIGRVKRFLRVMLADADWPNALMTRIRRFIGRGRVSKSRIA